MADDDSALLGQLALGDTSALAVLYERYRRPVYGRALIEVESRPDAEELLQDAFVLLWKKRKRLTIVGDSLLPWLLVSVRYLAQNRRRHLGRRRTTTLDERPEPSSDRNPEEVAARRELYDVVERSIRKLGGIDQEIFRLCVIEGLSYKQAAAKLETSHAVVRNRLGRARASVRADAAAYLTEEGR